MRIANQSAFQNIISLLPGCAGVKVRGELPKARSFW